MNLSRAITLTVISISLALVFNLGILLCQGQQKALEFLTGYIVELSLSIDNLFVFYLIFAHFKVSPEHRGRILTWGIWGAILMRAIFIFAGVVLLNKFHWIVYIFGSVLIFSGIKLFFEKDKEINPDKNIVLKLFRKIMPVDSQDTSGRFMIRRNGRWMATSLLIVLIVVETTDLIFAVDSIPAVLAITKDPFIVYSSNIFAILGLRALFFVLARVITMFHHLHYGLGIILVFVGTKMVTESFLHVSIQLALGFIIAVIGISIWTSILFPPKDKSHASIA